MPIKKKSAVTTSTAISFTENGQHEKDQLAPCGSMKAFPSPKRLSSLEYFVMNRFP
jgi:hypothetical protein